MHQRIRYLNDIDSAIRLLARLDYDVTSIIAQHNAWLDGYDRHEPTPDDERYAKRPHVLNSLEQHVVDGKHEILTAARCNEGWEYSLSESQRDYLRIRFDFTPPKTVVVYNVTPFKQRPDIIWSITLRSGMHVDPRNTRKFLHQVVLCPAAEFFRHEKPVAKSTGGKVTEKKDKNAIVLRMFQENYADL